MCGIAGLVSSVPLGADAINRVVGMRDMLTHRGPDEAGMHHDTYAALGHRRLSIVDLSTGQQPLANEDGTIWVVFNGEIYNHADLRQELEARGHCYSTRSDTETIIHAYEEWGDRAVERFRGMFAFAIWDSPKRRLLLVRDRLGIKPLYWTLAKDQLLFGSEIKAILASGLIQPSARVSALPELLSTRSIAGADTLFARIQKLLPGHLLVFQNGHTHVRQYWNLPLRDDHEAMAIPDRPTAAADVIPRFRALLNESVRLRLMSDVPLGMFLSGGIDSAAIAALMAPMLNQPLQTFSVAFQDYAFNELRYSREIAKSLGAVAHEIVIDDRDFFGALPKLVWHEDEPIAHTSSVPLYFVATLARRHVTVVLTGEGSDELLAGYGKYPRTVWNWSAGALYERTVPAFVRSAVARTLVPQLPKSVARYARRSFLAMDHTPEAMAFDNFASIQLADQHRLLSPSLGAIATSERAYGASLSHFEHPSDGSSLLDRLLYADIKTYLVELLMKQDQMSMAASIESRVPFLDHKLVEFAAALPDSWKLSGSTTKRILRASMKGILPPSILNRPKMGFPVPFAGWIRGAWNNVARDVLLDRRSRERGIVDPSGVAKLLNDHAAGRTEGGDRIWSLLNLELWYRTFIDGDGVQTLPAPADSERHAHSVAEIRPSVAAR